MATGVEWVGLDEYERELAALPEEVTKDNAGIQHDEAQETAEELRANYPVRTGRLQESVAVHDTADGATVENTAPYALAFEYGNGGGPGGKVFWPTVLRHRRAATRRMIGTLEGEKYGATVVGDAE